MVSIIKDRRYWLAGAINPAIDNDVVYILDLNNNWSKFDNIDAASFSVFKDDLYFGSSASNGKIYKYSSDFTNDDGTAIVPYIKTKDFDFGSNINDKYFNTLWIYAKPTTVFSTMTVNYIINKSNVYISTISVSLTADTSYPDYPIIAKIKRPTDRFRYINFRISDFDTLYGLVFKFGYELEGNR